MTDITIYDVSQDIERPVTQNDIHILKLGAECGYLYRAICRKLDIQKMDGIDTYRAPVDWAAYKQRLSDVFQFIECLEKNTTIIKQ